MLGRLKRSVVVGLTALGLLMSFPSGALADSKSKCAQSAGYGRSKVSSAVSIDHPSDWYGRGAARAGPSWATCDQMTWNADNVVDYYVEVFVDQLINGAWSWCAHSDGGWAGRAGGSWHSAHVPDWAMRHPCHWESFTLRAASQAKGLYNDGTVISVWAFTTGHGPVS